MIHLRNSAGEGRGPRAEPGLPRVLSLFAIFGLIVAPPVAGQDAAPGSALYYAIESAATVYPIADSTRPYLSLGLREPVEVLQHVAGWAHIRTQGGALGMVHARELSNTWVRVSKTRQTLFVYRGDELISSFAADLGYNFFADKEQRGSSGEPDHWRTPEGIFYVAAKNAQSQYHRALVLNYPNSEDASRGLADSLITQTEYLAILRADQSFDVPPMTTSLGGWIEIHGNGTGRRANWTQGCIAIRDDEIDRIWSWVHVGTPVIIEP